MSLCIAPYADLSASDSILLSWSCTATGRLALALADTPPQSATTFSQGNPRGSINGTDRSAWGTATGLTFPSAVSTHDEAALWLLTGLADPTGTDAPKPLGPTQAGRYELYAGGQRVIGWKAGDTSTPFMQQAQNKQADLQGREIKRLLQSLDVDDARVRKRIKQFIAGKVRNWTARKLDRDWQSKAGDLRDAWFPGASNSTLRAALATFVKPSTTYVIDGSEGSGVWTEVANGTLSTTWTFSSGNIRQDADAATNDYGSAQRYNTPFSVDDMIVDITLGTQSLGGSGSNNSMEPLSRMDSGANLDCYGAIVSGGGAVRLFNWVGGSGSVIGSAPANVASLGVANFSTRCDGTTISMFYDETGSSEDRGIIVTDTTHQGVDHVYFGCGAINTSNAAHYGIITQVEASDIVVAGGGLITHPGMAGGMRG